MSQYGYQSREYLEKTRLAARQGTYSRLAQHELNVQAFNNHNSTPNPQSNISTSIPSRNFDCTAQHIKQQSHEDKRRYDAKIHKLAYDDTKRQEMLWNQYEQESNIASKKVQQHVDSGTKAKKNVSSVSYDVVTMQYRNDADATKLRQRDEFVKERAQQRTHMLSMQQNKHGFNPITGEPVYL